MLHLFRRHQRIIFVFISIVIVISFSFFGTYDTVRTAPEGKQEEWTLFDGTSLPRQSMRDLTRLLVFQAAQDNEGVINRDFFHTGLAEILAERYLPLLQNDLQQRAEREKRFTPYTHPQVNFLSAEMAWKFFAPELKEHFDALKEQDPSVDLATFKTKIQLYLDQKRFPPSMLRQILHYQENQYSWVSADPNLSRQDLSLFGYHNLEDWFGPSFTQMLSQFVFNASHIAQMKGYSVSLQEAHADLLRLSEKLYRRHKAHLPQGITNGTEYFQQQLQHLGLEENYTASLWREVMLFRRLFDDVGNAVVEAPFAYRKFARYAGQQLEVKAYHLPPALRLSSFSALQKFETYLWAVAKESPNESLLPKEMLPLDTILERAPELVERKATLAYKKANKAAIEASVALRDMWDWELEESHWEILSEHFAELATMPSTTRDQRFQALETLDATTRNALDAFARAQIVESDPEWLEKAFSLSEIAVQEVNLRREGPFSLFVGTEEGRSLWEEVGSAPLTTEEEFLVSDQLHAFSSDGVHFYRVAVLDRSEEYTVLSYEEASVDGALDRLLDRRLRRFYEQHRTEHRDLFRKEQGSWKSFPEARRDVARLFFQPVIDDVLSAVKEKDATFSPAVGEEEEAASTYRLYAFMESIYNAIQENSDQAQEWIAGEKREPSSLLQQWQLIQSEQEIRRSTSQLPETEEIYSLSAGSWSTLYAPRDGDLHFYQVQRFDSDEMPVHPLLQQGQEGLSAGAQRLLMRDLLEKIAAGEGISFEQSIR